MRASSVTNEILDILKKEHTHLTEVEIYEAVKSKFTAVNHSTVYRALRRLVDDNQVSITDIGRGAQVFELCTNDAHHHLVCQSCGKIVNLTDGTVEELFEKIETDHGFHVITKHLALFGYCPECRAKMDKD
jgi:Fur family transcriptional regulator, ferric uptake regulator